VISRQAARFGRLRPSWNLLQATHLLRVKHVHSAKEDTVIKWAIIFFIISLVAGFFGFTGIAEGSRSIAKVLFFIALSVFLIVLVFGVLLGVLVF
jgi:uncharacterized membrane protein YtjA (UPF0391 family)